MVIPHFLHDSFRLSVRLCKSIVVCLPKAASSAQKGSSIMVAVAFFVRSRLMLKKSPSVLYLMLMPSSAGRFLVAWRTTKAKKNKNKDGASIHPWRRPQVTSNSSVHSLQSLPTWTLLACHHVDAWWYSQILKECQSFPDTATWFHDW